MLLLGSAFSDMGAEFVGTYDLRAKSPIIEDFR